MSGKVGIKVPVDSSVVKVVKTVKDIEPLPISEIKSYGWSVGNMAQQVLRDLNGY